MTRKMILAATFLAQTIGLTQTIGMASADERGAAITMAERTAIHEFFAQHYTDGRCAPGLSRFHNTCIPMTAARRFTVGRPLAQSVPASPAPLDLIERIAVPAGHIYMFLDGHVLLVESKKRIVIDAVSVSVAMPARKPAPRVAERETSVAE